MLTLSWNSVMSHSSVSRLVPCFSAAMYRRRFSCLIPGVMNISLSFCHDCLFCTDQKVVLPFTQITGTTCDDFNNQRLKCYVYNQKNQWLITYLNREDLYCNIFAHQLGLPNTAKSPPSFDFQQLQWFETHQGWWRSWPGVLKNRFKKWIFSCWIFLKILSSDT